MREIRFKSVEEAEAYLLSLVDYEVKTHYKQDTAHDLESFETRLRGLGWDPRSTPTIHVAGTNGKGSVALLLDALLRGGGKKTGLFTSPHLVEIRERIQINGRMIDTDAFRGRVESLARRADPSARGIRTTFEHLTAAAFLEFQESHVDWAIVEVGLGGRLDATNVLPAGKAVLTPVSLDHQNVLGETLEVIAGDKAHVFKRGGEAWVMPQEPEALRAVRRRLQGQQLDLQDPLEHVGVRVVNRSPAGSVLRVQGLSDYGEIILPILGTHQEQNLAAATALCETILNREAMQSALSSLEGFVLPARLQMVHRRDKTFLVDGGHNPGAARAAVQAIRDHFPGKSVVAVVGMARDKDVRGFLEILAPISGRMLATASGNLRALPATRVAQLVPSEVPVSATSTVDQALERVDAMREELVLVTGSFIVAGEALTWLRANS